MDITKVLVALSENLSVTLVLLGLAYGVYKEYVVTGSQYKQEQLAREREEKRAERAEERANKLETALVESNKTLSEQVSVNERTTRILEALANARGRNANGD